MALTPFDMEGVNRDLLAAGNPAKPDMQSILRRNARDLVLGNAILVSSVDARERFGRMLPLDGVEQSALEDYRREWMVRYVYNSNAIEGSTLTLEDTELVLEGEFVPADSPARYIFAARGVADGMAYAERFAEEKRRLDGPWPFPKAR